MRNKATSGVSDILSLTCKRLEAAELALGGVLRQLSMLDAEIASLVIARARGGSLTEDDRSFALIEVRRRHAALRIEELRRTRSLIEAESEKLRDETRRLLRQKIALESALSAAAEDVRRRRRNQQSNAI